jgi:ATP-dependent RNA helicase DDX27
MPNSLKHYVHRVGRTARAGRAGRSVSLVGDGERAMLRQVLKATAGQVPVKQRVIDFGTYPLFTAYCSTMTVN